MSKTYRLDNDTTIYFLEIIPEYRMGGEINPDGTSIITIIDTKTGETRDIKYKSIGELLENEKYIRDNVNNIECSPSLNENGIKKMLNEYIIEEPTSENIYSKENNTSTVETTIQSMENKSDKSANSNLILNISYEYNPNGATATMEDGVSIFKDILTTSITNALNDIVKKSLTEILSETIHNVKIIKEEAITTDNKTKQTELPLLRIYNKEWNDKLKFSDIDKKLYEKEAINTGAILFKGPPGGGKTEWAKYLAYELTGGHEERIVMMQFSPSTCYVNFLGGINSTEEGGFKLVDGAFKKLCNIAERDKDKTYYVMIIDEINRCNAGDAIGEMLNLMEARGTELVLNNGSKMSMPENIIVIATMNTFDSGINGLQFALLNRFSTFEITGANTKIRDLLKDADKDTQDVGEKIWNDIIPSINKEIEKRKKTKAYNITQRPFGYKLENIKDLQCRVKARILPHIELILGNEYGAAKSAVDTLIKFTDNDISVEDAPYIIMEYK